MEAKSREDFASLGEGGGGEKKVQSEKGGMIKVVIGWGRFFLFRKGGGGKGKKHDDYSGG